MIDRVIFSPSDYIAFNQIPYMMKNLKKFCVDGDSILRVDTTFELVDGLWLTDTTYSNEALLDSNGKHPEFPGPSMWHFKKNRETYRRFAGELVMNTPSLIELKKIGHDLDVAIPNGLTDLFTTAKKLWCTQHMQERDAFKLKQLGANKNTVKRIMADIYGSQDDVIFQAGLADSADREDFSTKLESLQDIWDDLLPGFFSWFKKRRSVVFQECLIMQAREELGISGRFYTNGLELKHKLQKKVLREEEVPQEVAAVSEVLQNWAAQYQTEEVRAIRGLGKYHLAPGYDKFFVEPTTWNRWGPDRQAEHLKKFSEFRPAAYNSYQKPKKAGHKASPDASKRRARLPEPEMFEDRLETQSFTHLQAKRPCTVSPLRITKCASSENNAEWKVSVY
eukprot:Seg3052.3 transcript_id=Seg3052.3/GoldUCD/mRNA.D3Y31 product="hypothetical protein" protein_id=Seg3052.3/GoldUCD/D3Y31